MKLKIGRNEYEIDDKDEFMDNGACIQLLSQSEEKSYWGRRPNPILSKKAERDINKYTRIQLKHHYSDSVQIFTLNMKE